MSESKGTTPIGFHEIVESISFPGVGATLSGEIWTNLKKCGRWPWWRHLTPLKAKKGYLVVEFHFEGRLRRVFVHKLVLEAFAGSCPKGMECRHLNGNPTDNRPENLAWGTHAENMQDAVTHGSMTRVGDRNRGAGNGNSKLKENDVIEIRRLRLEGLSWKKIANHFGVGMTTVRKAAEGRTWKHVLDRKEV